jgi:hypothetical protein
MIYLYLAEIEGMKQFQAVLGLLVVHPMMLDIVHVD